MIEFIFDNQNYDYLGARSVHRSIRTPNSSTRNLFLNPIFATGHNHHSHDDCDDYDDDDDSHEHDPQLLNLTLLPLSYLWNRSSSSSSSYSSPLSYHRHIHRHCHRHDDVNTIIIFARLKSLDSTSPLDVLAPYGHLLMPPINMVNIILPFPL